MKIVKDTQKLINIHPLMIYFILPPKSYEKHAARLKQLNSDEWFTRGVFKFNAISRRGEVENVLSDDLKKAFFKYNIMVRLVDDADGNHCYAFSNVVFVKLIFDYFVRLFVIKICKKNIRHLKKQLLSDHSIPNGYDKHNKKTKKQEILSLFEHVIKNKFHHTQPPKERLSSTETTWRTSSPPKIALYDEQEYEIKHCDYCREEEQPYGNIKELLTTMQEMKIQCKERGFTKDEIKDLWYLIYLTYDTKDEKTSDRIVQKVFKKASIDKPNISVEIKQIVKKILKNGKEKKEYGMEFCVDGEKFSVCFGSKESTMMYICTLLRQKMGKRMYIHEFFNNSTGIKTSHAWIKEVFEKIFPAMDTDFEDWINKIEDARGRPLNQGKTNANTMVMEVLQTHQYGVRFCTIETRDKKKDAYYMINIQSENIFVAPELEFLIGDSQRFTNE